MAKIQARVPDEIQDIANLVIKSTGLTVSDVVRMFMTRIATDKALPLDLNDLYIPFDERNNDSLINVSSSVLRSSWRLLGKFIR